MSKPKRPKPATLTFTGYADARNRTLRQTAVDVRDAVTVLALAKKRVDTESIDIRTGKPIYGQRVRVRVTVEPA